ncbi:MAG TPA: S9 family peptidase [Steroidobacteraceae bacterium]|nr:S9 family peptidase [Steroidobacteraceae bacterium]
MGLACLASPPFLSAQSKTPLEVYGRLPTLEDLALSPDGTEIAFVRTSEDARNIYVVRMEDRRALGGARVGDFKLRYIEWLDNDNLLTALSITSLPPAGFWGVEQEWTQLIDYSIPQHKLRPVSFRVSDQTTFNVAAGAPMVREVKGAALLFVPGLYVTNETLPGLFSYDVASGRMKLMEKGTTYRTQWLVDGSGAVAGEFAYRDQFKDWKLTMQADGRSRIVAAGTAPLDVPVVLGFDAGGTSILMAFMEEGGWVWRPIRIKDGAIGDPLSDGETFRRPITDRKTGRIVGGVRGPEDTRYVFFDSEMQAHWDAILRAFPGERVELASRSDDFTRILVRVFGPKDGYVYAMFDWYSHRTKILGNVYEGLSGVAEVKRIRYQATDGFTVPAILTLPVGRAPTNLPLVVLPHGGPAAADSDTFDWWAQALADQGYAVLQPNYRGSSLNEQFIAAGYGEWGRKMQTDLSDGVRYLAHEGTIDPKRVCIVGASYGGYAALAGVTLDPGMYRCAVSVAGIADLKGFLKWTDNRAGRSDNISQRYWDRFMGVKNPADPALQAISPIEHIGAVTAPVLLIHGRDDTVVPYEQSEAMARALKRAGKPVEFVTLAHEDHWLSRSATRLQMLQATVAFLKANNPPD